MAGPSRQSSAPKVVYIWRPLYGRPGQLRKASNLFALISFNALQGAQIITENQICLVFTWRKSK